MNDDLLIPRHDFQGPILGLAVADERRALRGRSCARAVLWRCGLAQTAHSAQQTVVQCKRVCVWGYIAADRRDHPRVSRVNIGESQERVYTLFIENDLGFATF